MCSDLNSVLWGAEGASRRRRHDEQGERRCLALLPRVLVLQIAVCVFSTRFVREIKGAFLCGPPGFHGHFPSTFCIMPLFYPVKPLFPSQVKDQVVFNHLTYLANAENAQLLKTTILKATSLLSLNCRTLESGTLKESFGHSLTHWGERLERKQFRKHKKEKRDVL